MVGRRTDGEEEERGRTCPRMIRTIVMFVWFLLMGPLHIFCSGNTFACNTSRASIASRLLNPFFCMVIVCWAVLLTNQRFGMVFGRGVAQKG